MCLNVRNNQLLISHINDENGMTYKDLDKRGIKINILLIFPQKETVMVRIKSTSVGRI